MNSNSLELAIKDANAVIACLRRAFNPRRWTKEMQAAWHRSLPDTQLAFGCLLSAALVAPPCVSDEHPAGEDRDSGLSGEAMPARPTPNHLPPPLGDIGEVAKKLDLLAYSSPAIGFENTELCRKAATAIETQAAEIERLKPFEDELRKIAEDLGEPDDPFAAWESVATLKARIAELEKERDEERANLDQAVEGALKLSLEVQAAEARLKDAEKVIEAVDATAVLIQRGRTYKEYAIPGEVLGRIAAFLSTTGGDNG